MAIKKITFAARGTNFLRVTETLDTYEIAYVSDGPVIQLHHDPDTITRLLADIHIEGWQVRDGD